MAHEPVMCMVFTPTKEEFSKPFCEYVRKIFRKYPDLPMFKVVPPKGWKARKSPFPDLNKVHINVPIRQHCFGTKGAYRCLFVEEKPMTVADFKRISEEEVFKVRSGLGRSDVTPATSGSNGGSSTAAAAASRQHALATRDVLTQSAAEDALMERSFWSSVTVNPPLYGADTPTSFFDSKLPYGWNLQRLGDLLSENDVQDIPGVTTPMTYFGMWRSFFGWHKEDADLYSTNFLHWGSPKVWYCVAPSDAAKFERMAQGLFPDLHKSCPAFIRHKDVMMSPSVLRTYNVPFVQAKQGPGEFIILNATAYHSGFNTGFNCAEAVNFATKEWVTRGKVARPCKCEAMRDGVRIDMKIFDPKWVDPYASSDEEDEDDDDDDSSGQDDEGEGSDGGSAVGGRDDSNTGSGRGRHVCTHFCRHKPGEHGKRKRRLGDDSAAVDTAGGPAKRSRRAQTASAAGGAVETASGGRGGGSSKAKASPMKVTPSKAFVAPPNVVSACAIAARLHAAAAALAEKARAVCARAANSSAASKLLARGRAAAAAAKAKEASRRASALEKEARSKAAASLRKARVSAADGDEHGASPRSGGGGKGGAASGKSRSGSKLPASPRSGGGGSRGAVAINTAAGGGRGAHSDAPTAPAPAAASVGTRTRRSSDPGALMTAVAAAATGKELPPSPMAAVAAPSSSGVSDGDAQPVALTSRAAVAHYRAQQCLGAAGAAVSAISARAVARQAVEVEGPPAALLGHDRRGNQFFYLVQRLKARSGSSSSVLLRWLKECRDGMYRPVDGTSWEERPAALVPVITEFIAGDLRTAGGWKLLTNREHLLSMRLAD